MDWWTKIGTIAAVVAAVGGIAAVIVSWLYGRRTDGDARRAVRYERLREARELVSRIQYMGDATRYGECNDLCSQLEPMLALLDASFPQAERLAAKTTWDLESWNLEHFSDLARDAKEELDAAIRQLR
jgi:hypothetical protein